jgi:hypothetical protein
VEFSLKEKSQVGKLSPKDFHPRLLSAIADIASVFGRKLVLPNGLEFDFLPRTGSSWLVPTQPYLLTKIPLIYYKLFFRSYPDFILCFNYYGVARN